MIPYYFVLFLFFVIWLIGSFYNDYKQSRLIECIFGFIILTILLGIRDSSVGVDLERYISTYNDLNPEFFFSGNLLNKVSFTEPGYLVYIAVLKILGFTSFGYVFITSAIIISSYAVFIYRYSSSVTLSFFIFITFGLMAISMSTLRQSLSIAFFLWAVTYYLDKSYFKVALLIGISIMFHYSAAIVLVFLALVKKPLQSFVVIAGILGIGYLFFSDVVLFIGRRVFEGYYNYVHQNQLSWLYLAVYLFVYIFIYWSFMGKKRGYRIRDDDGLMFFMATFAILLFIASFFFGSIVSRLAFYFVPSFLILLPRALNEFAKGSRAIIVVSLVILFTVYFVLSTIGGILSIDHYKVSETLMSNMRSTGS